MTRKIRIVSDVHLGHKASLVERAEALRPFADGVDHLIFNGDTLELKYGDLDDSHYDAAKQKLLFDEEVARWGAKVTLITGNHDPAISEVHSVSLLDGEVFITHGDGLFTEVAPWSSSVHLLRQCASDIDPQATGTTEQDLHDYLQLHKDVSIQAQKLDDKYNPTLWGKLKIFLHQTWPPTIPFRILKCWSEMPDRAVSLTSRFGLAPRFIIVGHTHNPGIWRRGGQTVINLGSLFQWPGSRCVDIEGERLSVRKIRKRQNRISIGPVLKEFSLQSRQATVSRGISLSREAPSL